MDERKSEPETVLSKDDVMPLLVAACPSYRRSAEDRDLLYVELGDFARHLLELHQQHCTAEFSTVARALERFLIAGDDFVREATTIGLLEGIQNTWDSSDADPEAFAEYLLPVSTKWWQSLNDFWSGKSRYVGEGHQAVCLPASNTRGVHDSRT